MSESTTPIQVQHEVLTVARLLAMPELEIPIYQRPYQWTGINVRQLFEDLAAYQDQPTYRLGTVVFHEEKEKLNIVDGQQRIITLILTVRALLTERKSELKGTELRKQLTELEPKLMDPKFPSDISHKNVRENYQEINRIVTRPEFTETQIDFLLNRCQVVTFTLTDISEAFQFFDAQNARGRDLEPHDLLKAYHLREFGDESEAEKARTVERWENSKTEELAVLFERYLYRIRKWARGISARAFGKSETALFKGVNLQTTDRYPYVEPLRIAHYFVDRYQGQLERKIDGHDMAFPFQLDQIIINGRRFFEMTAHYQEMVDRFTDHSRLLAELDGVQDPEKRAAEILQTINNYNGRFRTGDQHVRSLFDCLLIYYWDKFGAAELSRAIEKIFIWAYTLRLKQSRVSLASVDRYVLESNLFQQIKESVEPRGFLSGDLDVLSENNSTQTDEIAGLFEKMKYLNKKKQP